MHVSNHHIVHFRYLTIFCQLYLSKARKKVKTTPGPSKTLKNENYKYYKPFLY